VARRGAALGIAEPVSDTLYALLKLLEESGVIGDQVDLPDAALHIHVLNGYVARRAAALGIATPVSDTLYALVKLLEESGVNRRSG
jgi:ketopantoate reductase